MSGDPIPRTRAEIESDAELRASLLALRDCPGPGSQLGDIFLPRCRDAPEDILEVRLGVYSDSLAAQDDGVEP